jgi:parvulin-like peptidyl-prolyl isomerase
MWRDKGGGQECPLSLRSSAGSSPALLLKRSQLRLVVCSAILLYLAGDLFVFTGPLRQLGKRRLPDSPQSIEKAKAEEIVAMVQGHPVFLSQITRATEERLWMSGKAMEDLSPGDRKKEHLAALEELIDHQLLRAGTKEEAGRFTVAEGEVDTSLKRLASAFGGSEAMMKELAAEGIDSEKELRLRLGARLQQEKFIESRIADRITVTAEEVREWMKAHAVELTRPERIKVRHVFLSTHTRDGTEAKEALQKALAELEEKQKDFAALSAALSEDPRSKAAGGELGWMTRNRLPADFATPAFAMAVNRPGLVRTKLGWHLVEVTDRKPAETRSEEEAQAGAAAALTAVKRRDAVAALRKSLREQAGGSIRVFSEMIPE